MERLANFMELTEHELFRSMSVKFQAELILQAWQHIGGGIRLLMYQWENIVCEVSPPDSEKSQRLADLMETVIPDTIRDGVKAAFQVFWQESGERIDAPNEEGFLKALQIKVAQEKKNVWLGMTDLEARVDFIETLGVVIEVNALAKVSLCASFTGLKGIA